MQKLLSGMTLEEKVGQMTQPEITAITPAEVGQYHIGSVLNGGGAWPGGEQARRPRPTGSRSPTPTGRPRWRPGHPGASGASTPSTATTTSTARRSSRTTSAWAPRTTRAWSATSEAATAEQVRSTGQDWAFAPTLAVVRDDRWGRTYEGFSEDPRITRAYGYEAMRACRAATAHGIGDDGVIGTAKHFIGDGGTDGGKDQGVNPSSEAEMINIHGQGYYGALAAGAQSVMVSFNSWTNETLGITEGKLHG